MPTISRFYGVVIRMYHNEHLPPHFHAVYGDSEVAISIEQLEVLVGTLPRRALVLVLDWAALHQRELMEDWELCRSKEHPKKIAPLD